MRVLVVGCGYVGLQLAIQLVKQGHEVYGVNRTQAAGKSLESLGIKPLLADITVPESLSPLPSVYDWVVNCVSATAGGAGAYHAVYVEAMRNLLNWLAPSPPGRFLYTSSTSVYGQTDGGWVDEASPTQPEAQTAQTLLEAEQLLLEATQCGRVPGLLLRVAGIYGPGRGYWLKQFLSGEARLEGDGQRVLNMIHRDDVVGAIIAALERGQPGNIYNAVDNEPVTQLVLFEWLAGQLGRPLPPKAEEPSESLRKRGLTSKRISNQKLRTELGYQFRFPTFREGFAAELGNNPVTSPKAV